MGWPSNSGSWIYQLFLRYKSWNISKLSMNRNQSQNTPREWHDDILRSLYWLIKFHFKLPNTARPQQSWTKKQKKWPKKYSHIILSKNRLINKPRPTCFHYREDVFWVLWEPSGEVQQSFDVVQLHATCWKSQKLRKWGWFWVLYITVAYCKTQSCKTEKMQILELTSRTNCLRVLLNTVIVAFSQ